MSFRLRLGVLVLAALLAAAHAAYWFHAAGALRKGLDDFAARKRAEGWTVHMPAPAITGYPLQVTARLGEIVLITPEAIEWRPSGIGISLDLLDPLNPRLDLAGMHRLAGAGWRGVVSAKTAAVRLRLDAQGRLGGMAVDAEALVLEQAGLDPLVLSGLTLDLDFPRPADTGHKAAWAALTLGLRGLELPPVPGLSLERRIERVQVEARIMGTPPPGPALDSLAAWSAEGGMVELDRIALDWPPLALDANATLALGPDLQPLLAGTARLRGWSDMVARLTQAGLVEPGMAAAAQIMLAILARPDTQGRPTLSVPLALQDGILSVGQVRVMRVPPLPIPVPQPGARLP